MNLNELLHKSIHAFSIGDYFGAITAAEKGLKLYPYISSLHEIRSRAYRLIRNTDKYINSLKDWHYHLPWVAEVCFQIASELICLAQTLEAQKWLDLGLSLLEIAAESRKLPYSNISYARLKHDSLQLDYLVRFDVLDKQEYQEVLSFYGYLIQKYFPNGYSEERIITLAQDELMGITPFYRRCLYIYPEKIPQSIFNNNIDLVSISDEFNHSGLSVIDNFLSDETFDELRQYLLFSTIWHNDSQKGLSYLGAYQDTGGLSLLISTIDEHIRKAFSSIIGTSKLEQVWSYKNVYGSKAVGTHADFSSVNINLWMTPDKFCHNSRGGLIVYKQNAPIDWNFSKYNDDESGIAQLLENVDSTVIPYRANRAVIFDSSLFHCSDECQFEDSYEGLRINLTLLYGRRD
ncbi:MAG: hypothetical protein GPI90_14380 [Microcystis aeruginosa K13-05]|jgi:hypothetical protein|uniref:hypothetical protein n=1 Tax=Microcystis sp. LE19-41.2A TaxID=3016427 RepID=UPI0022CA706A|nr:hypothetical protein [Microcystis sp. LE19-41.2A]MCZ8048262.1 hypothetical protein [Microcystis sp. LE19-41.2A]NCR81164.1 hypothetical protein [Microcystis aeruginosa K13-10]NCR85769.1 hypothetical protein [Microcystis aeruginosa K13-05]